MKQFYCCSMWWKYRFCCSCERKHLCLIPGCRYVPANIFISWKTYPVKLLMTLSRLLNVFLVFTTCIIFIANDWASVSSGLKCETGAKYREEEKLSWLSFIFMSICNWSNNVYVISSVCMKIVARNQQSFAYFINFWKTSMIFWKSD